MREIFLFQCTECKNKNYSTRKNKKNTTDKLQRKKYCRHCRNHTPHKETKA
ncbi:MAG: 50S ribosomal protein L33 [Thermodesulfovibrio sp.]|nr:50S ribosomal protein L33 [Thermodesulfovibrio sp.]